MISNSEIEKRIKDSYELENNVIKYVPKPLVTVRTSTYQHGSYIKQCIEGVLMQKTDFDFEFIIGEDFSTDETREIVFDYAKRYPNIIRVITADYNVGSKANGRRCINAARGKYMALCEGDDYWIDPSKLQKQIDFLRLNEDCTLVFHLANRVTSDDDVIGVHGPKMNKDNGLFNIKDAILQASTLVPTNSMLFETSYAKNLPEWTLQSPIGDIPLTLILAHNGNLGFINEVMSNYRVMATNSWSESLHKSFAKRKIHYGKLKRMWKSFDLWTGKKYHSYVIKRLSLDFFIFFATEFKIRSPKTYGLLKKVLNLYE